MKGKRSVVKISSINYVKLSRESNIIIWGFWVVVVGERKVACGGTRNGTSAGLPYRKN